VSTAFIVLTALVVGLAVGTTSIGGVILIPALVAWGGVDVHKAAATTLASFLPIGGLAAWLFARRGSVDWRLVWPLCLGAAPCGYLGATLAARIAAQPLSIAIGVLIVLASLMILRPPRAISPAAARSRPVECWLLAGMGALAGIGSGLSGAGGPIFSVPLMLLAGFAPLASIAAAMAFAIVAALSGSAANIQAGLIDFELFALLVVCQVAGIVAGVRLAHALPVAVLKQAVAWMCVLAGLLMIYRSIG
jgi:uncharacterized membrane protein YfcA